MSSVKSALSPVVLFRPTLCPFFTQTASLTVMKRENELIAFFMCCLHFSKAILLRWHILHFTIGYNRTFDPALAALEGANQICLMYPRSRSLSQCMLPLVAFKSQAKIMWTCKTESRCSLRNDWVSTAAAVASEPARLWRRQACHERGLFNLTWYLSPFLHNFWFNFLQTCHERGLFNLFHSNFFPFKVVS